MEDRERPSSAESSHQVTVTVLFSGGIDSMVCAHLLMSQGYGVNCLFVDYGQPAAAQEKKAAKLLVTSLPLASFVSCAATPVSALGSGEIAGRNGFLIFSALTLAGVQRGVLAMGIHAGTPYYDCSLDFARRISNLVEGYTDGCLQLLFPLIEWSKPEIVAYAHEHGLPVRRTYSCEAGTSPPCGKCYSCLDRRSIGC
jgi:7-cyano-7-deazaguanine synthase